MTDVHMYIYIYIHMTNTHDKTTVPTPHLIHVRCSRNATTGWRRPTGCPKLQVILRKRATNYRALLQKMTYEDKASYDSTPPSK